MEQIDILKRSLEEELSKPFAKQNTNKIMDIVAKLTEYEENETKSLILKNKTECFSNITSGRNRKKSTLKILRRSIVCLATLLIGLNVYTVSAYNENVFSFLIEFTKGGVLIQFNDSQKDEVIIPTEENDPYGIIAKCKENGIENIETPHYIPEGFILTNLETNNNEFSKYIHFTYEKGNQLISLTFEEYPDEIPEKIGIPSDEHNVTEIKINGHSAIMSREDDQMIVLCAYKSQKINILTRNIDYSECDKILDSCKIV